MQTPSGRASGADVERSPSFSLGTALVLLGHDCQGGCPRSVQKCRAKTWFIHLSNLNTAWTMTLVDVEFEQIDWPESRTRTLLSEINACLHPDHIRVRQRSVAERGVFLTALAARRRAPALPSAVSV